MKHASYSKSEGAFAIEWLSTFWFGSGKPNETTRIGLSPSDPLIIQSILGS